MVSCILPCLVLLIVACDLDGNVIPPAKDAKDSMKWGYLATATSYQSSHLSIPSHHSSSTSTTHEATQHAQLCYEQPLARIRRSNPLHPHIPLNLTNLHSTLRSHHRLRNFRLFFPLCTNDLLSPWISRLSSLRHILPLSSQGVGSKNHRHRSTWNRTIFPTAGGGYIRSCTRY